VYNTPSEHALSLLVRYGQLLQSISSWWYINHVLKYHPLPEWFNRSCPVTCTGYSIHEVHMIFHGLCSLKCVWMINAIMWIAVSILDQTARYVLYKTNHFSCFQGFILNKFVHSASCVVCVVHGIWKTAYAWKTNVMLSTYVALKQRIFGEGALSVAKV
jgi:hypothetical protein